MFFDLIITRNMINQSTIEEFQQVVRKETGVELDMQEAQKILADLVSYFDLLAKIDHRNKIKKNEIQSSENDN